MWNTIGYRRDARIVPPASISPNSLGSINADFQERTPRPLQAGETLLGTDFVRLDGGKAADVAYLAHKLGCSTRLLGRVGRDVLREQALAPLHRAGLCLDHVGAGCADRDLHEPLANRSVCATPRPDDFDPSNSTSAEEGLHLGAMADTLDVLQRYHLEVGLRDDGLVVTPAPPQKLGPVCMRLQYHGALLTLKCDGARLALRADPFNRVAVPVSHAGRVHRIAAGSDVSFVSEM